MNETILAITLNLVGLILFLFTLFRRMKEDYANDIIFTTSFYILLGIGAGNLVSRFNLSTWWFWLESLGISLGLTVAIIRYKLRFFEVFESSFVSLLPWFSLVFLADSVINSSLASFLAFVATLGILTLFYYLEASYKNFVWYSSGKAGFSGMTTFATFFLLRGLLAYFFPFVLSFVGRFDSLISGIIALIAFYEVYNLSRS